MLCITLGISEKNYFQIWISEIGVNLLIIKINKQRYSVNFLSDCFNKELKNTFKIFI